MAKSSLSSGTIVGILVAIFVAILMIVAIGSASGFSNSSSPNQSGAETAQAENPTDPSVELYQKELSGYVDPQATMTSKASALAALSSQIQQWQATVHAGSSTMTTANQTAFDTKAADALTTITKLQALIGKTTGDTTDTNNVTSLETELKTNSDAMTEIIKGNDATSIHAIAVAEQVIAQNNNGTGSIKYIPGGDTPSGMDCSGFLSYVLQQIGLTQAHFTTTSLPNMNDLVQTIASGTDTSPISLTALSALNLKPGDILVSDAPDSKGLNGHMVMYLGGSFSDPKSIAESTAGNGLSGPQYTSVNARLAPSSRHLLYVLRPDYAS